MPDAITLTPFDRPVQATVAPPGSKSLTNRALVLAALASGDCTLTNVLFADDTLVMLDGLRALGFALDVDEAASTVRVHGRGGAIPSGGAELFCGNSGTTIRFLSALASLGHGTFTLDGVARMRQRPIGALTGLLRQLGADAAHAPAADGFPPVQVIASGLRGGAIRHGSEASSQYLSAVLMVAPYARDEVSVALDGRQTSWPYVAMTMQLMDHFGVTCELLRDPATGDPRTIVVPQGVYRPTAYAVEPDASAATYFLAVAAISPGSSVTVEGLGTRSLQGDVGFARLLHDMGADIILRPDLVTVFGTDRLRGIDADLSAMPDAAMTLATVAALATGRTTLRGLHTLRVKETDRLEALRAELTKLGAAVAIDGDALVIDPMATIRPATIKTYDDHRMAMAFAVVGTRAPGITIEDPTCVNKTYPGFWRDLENLRAGE